MPPETTATAPEQAASYLAPTLLIGLGGSGKDVLLRVRRLFYERHGRRADGSVGFPVVGYLALDTDPGAFERLEARAPATSSSATSSSSAAARPKPSTAPSSHGNWKITSAAANRATRTSSAGCRPS